MTRTATSIATPSLPLRFSVREFSGALGDLGTFLPLAIAMSLVCGMDLGVIFLFAGLMNIATGWWLRQPVPVQPMKAIVAVAVAEELSAGEIASAGMCVGAAVLVLAMVGGVDWVVRAVPRSVVRGIQAGVGLKLAIKGVAWLYGLPMLGLDSWAVAIGVGVAVALFVGLRSPVLLYVCAVGLGLMWLGNPGVSEDFVFSWPEVGLVRPTANEWWDGLVRGAIPQLPLTLLNSVVAVCALSADYFPGRGIHPRKMATSVGLMNLLCVPFGGLPMCHGAGGLAAQYRFGARTGGSVVMLGVLKVVVGLFFGGIALSVLQHYPVSVLAVLLVVTGLTLASAARDALCGSSLYIVIVVAALILLGNVLVGVVVGCALAWLVLNTPRFARGE